MLLACEVSSIHSAVMSAILGGVVAEMASHRARQSRLVAESPAQWAKNGRVARIGSAVIGLAFGVNSHLTGRIVLEGRVLCP